MFSFNISNKIITMCKKEYNKLYYQQNKERLKSESKRYRDENKESVLKHKKDKYSELKSNEEQYNNLLQKRKDYVKINKEKINNRNKKRYFDNPIYKKKNLIRNKIGTGLRRLRLGKSPSKVKISIIECTYSELKNYLELQFEPWMNWDNYGKYNGKLGYGWDIDHEIPLRNCKTVKDVEKLNHYTNLRPLDSRLNRADEK